MTYKGLSFGGEQGIDYLIRGKVENPYDLNTIVVNDFGKETHVSGPPVSCGAGRKYATDKSNEIGDEMQEMRDETARQIRKILYHK